MKVLHVIPDIADRTGGPARSVLESSRVLSNYGVRCTVATTDLGEAASAPQHTRITPQSTFIPRDVDIRMHRAHAPRRIAFSRPLARDIKARVSEYDVVHIHSLFLYPQYAAYKESFRAGVPFIVSPCGALDPYLRSRSRAAKALVDFAWQGAMLRRAAAIHFKTDDERVLASDLELAERQFVVANGLEVDLFQNLPDGSDFRQRHLNGRAGPIVLNVGRLSHKKGLDLLIQAFAQVRPRHPDASLVLVGPDDEDLLPRLRRLAAEQEVQQAVFFTGMLRGAELRGALSAATVWALPSKTENFGSSVVEALAAGVPVVVSPEVNLAPAIRAADAGVICERSPEAFAEAIGSVLADVDRRSVWSTRGRMFATQFDWQEIAPQLREMYEAVAFSRPNLRSVRAAA